MLETRQLPTELHELTVAQAGALLRARQLTSAELTADALARIERLDPALHAFITVTAETARRRTDTRYCGPPERANLSWRTDDIRAIDFPAGSFDLVHSRLTFCHLTERESLVATAARWLAPGGWLVIGDPMCMPAAGSVHEPIRRFFGALEAGWHAQGSDMTRWAQTIPSQLARAGLRDIGVLTRANCLGDTGPYGALAFANLRQEGAYLAGRGWLSQADVDAVIALCADPGFTDLRSITVYGWGRRALTPLEAG